MNECTNTLNHIGLIHTSWTFDTACDTKDFFALNTVGLTTDMGNEEIPFLFTHDECFVLCPPPPSPPHVVITDQYQDTSVKYHKNKQYVFFSCGLVGCSGLAEHVMNYFPLMFFF